MHTLRKLSMFLVLLGGLASLQACNDGPLEDAGEEIDEAIEDTADSIEDATD